MMQKKSLVSFVHFLNIKMKVACHIVCHVQVERLQEEKEQILLKDALVCIQFKFML